MNLLIGVLVGVVALILYEQGQKTVPAVTGAAAASSGVNTSANPIAATPAAGTFASASAKLPQFNAAQNGSIIDLSQQPVFNGMEFTCSGGSVPYYDPSTQTVYCVIPGAQPNSNDGSGALSGAVSDVPWYEAF